MSSHFGMPVPLDIRSNYEATPVKMHSCMRAIPQILLFILLLLYSATYPARSSPFTTAINTGTTSGYRQCSIVLEGGRYVFSRVLYVYAAGRSLPLHEIPQQPAFEAVSNGIVVITGRVGKLVHFVLHLRSLTFENEDSAILLFLLHFSSIDLSRF